MQGVICSALHIAVLTAVLVHNPAARQPNRTVPQVACVSVWLVMVAASALVPDRGQAIGVLAATCTTLGLFPQVLALLRDRNQDVSGLSVVSTRLWLLSSSLWTVYGVLGDRLAVAAPSLLAALTAVVTLLLLRPPPKNFDGPTTPARRYPPARVSGPVTYAPEPPVEKAEGWFRARRGPRPA